MALGLVNESVPPRVAGQYHLASTSQHHLASTSQHHLASTSQHHLAVAGGSQHSTYVSPSQHHLASTSQHHLAVAGGSQHPTYVRVATSRVNRSVPPLACSGWIARAPICIDIMCSPCQDAVTFNLIGVSNPHHVERHRHSPRLLHILPNLWYLVAWRPAGLNRSLSQSLPVSLLAAK